MNRVPKQIVALILAFLLLFSTLTFKVDMHFCGDHLVDFSFTSNVAGCKMSEPTTGATAGCLMAILDCCTDVEFLLSGQEDLKASSNNFSFTSNVALALLQNAPTLAALAATVPDHHRHFRDYVPPPLIREVHLLHETFLI